MHKKLCNKNIDEKTLIKLAKAGNEILFAFH